MNKILVFQNNLQDILDKKKMTQKDLAKLIGEREASVSEFINFKRTTLNIDLVLKILSALELENLDELISLRRVFLVKNYVQNQWYTFSCNKRAKFAYICNADEENFEFVEIMENGTLFHQKYPITEYGEDEIKREFSKLDVTLPDNANEDKISLMLIELCKYQGKQVSAMRYKSLNDALETLEILY